MWLAAGESASYDFSFGASWSVREVAVVTRDPLNVSARLEIRGAGADAVEGVLDVRKVAYSGPGGRWQIDAHGFTVSIIPHTQHATTLTRKQVGEGVNLEVDLIGKYVEKLLGAFPVPGGGVTLEQLKENGFV